MVYAVIAQGGLVSQALSNAAPNRRLLNVKLYDPNNLVLQLAAGQFRLRKALYRITAYALAYQVNHHQLGIFRDGILLPTLELGHAVGSIVYAGATTQNITSSQMDGVFHRVADEAIFYELMHAVETSNANNTAGGYAAVNPFSVGAAFSAVTVQVVGS